ncbi:hypothetical protein HID58_017521 [Brassica napus]|uniref:1-(5-phosphoribosyl)-5-[(5-phosphoribosylamino)methylideneamino] imidazole-4-carboxamide isomerase HISN3, chloroplastic n=1 Tax=Brassica napus TaxID=3708 RepID=A0ABQ8D7C4_BRANA|nr:hypothetical protein HID58_017521 [Brassica napus]
MRTYSSQFYSNGGIPCFQKNQSSLFNKHPKLSVPLLSKKKKRPLRVQVVSAVQFRPCIDIHKGKVKQIVGSTLSDSKEDGSVLVTNFESDKSAEEYAKMYKEDGLTGGHVIMLGADPLSQAAALGALHAYPGGLQVGGGISSENCLSYRGRSKSCYCHFVVIIMFTTVDVFFQYVFNNGKLDLERLKDLVKIVGKQRLILDLSCRKKDGRYAIVTDRWQKFSDVLLDEKSLEFLGGFADEFLVHGVDVEGKKLGIDEELVALLGNYSPIPVTYAGGVTVMDDVERIKEAGKGRVDVTVGSALDIFGGNLPYKDVVAWHHQQQESSSALH